MAWLESPCGAVRVLLLDDRLLSSSVQCSERFSRNSGSDDDLSGFYSPCENAIDGEMRISRSTAGVNNDGVASGPELEWRSSPSTLLLGIAAMSRESSDNASSGSSIATDGPERGRNSAGQCLSGRESSRKDGDVKKKSRIGLSRGEEGGGVARNGREWFPQAEEGVGKGFAGMLDVEVQTRSSVGRRRSESENLRARTNDGERGLEGVPKGRGVFESGGRREGVVYGEACFDERNEGRSRPLAKGWRRSERPFPTLEVTLLGNLGGSLRVVPNRYL